jgi:putative ABC transport system permease protein
MRILRAVRVSVRELTANKVRTLFMLLGVVIGIIALTVIISVGQGAKADVQQRMEQRLAVSLVTIAAGGGIAPGMRSHDVEIPTTLTADDATAIQTALPDVVAVGLVQNRRDVSVKHGSQSTTTTVQGVTPNFPRLRATPIASGEFFGDEEQASLARVAVLGPDTAEALFGQADPLGETIQIENVQFKVIGIVASQGTGPGGANLDDRIYIPQATAARRVFNQTHLNQILVRMTSPDQVAPATDTIKSLLRERHQIAPGTPDDFTVRISEEMLAVFTGTTQTLTLFLSLVAALSLLVGGFVLMNIMLISVSERKKEIGLRRAVGARRRDIVTQFLLEAVIVTALGGLLGVILGVGGAFVASRLMGWPAALSWPAVIGAVLFAALVGVVFALQPARKAAALHPVEALRD